MTSQFEDTPVDDLDVSSLSEDQLRDIAENDSRVTAQAKAQAELNRQEGTDTPAASTDVPDVHPKLIEVKAPSGETHTVTEAREDAGTLRNSAGEEYKAPSLAAGAGQVQADFDKMTASGVWPPDAAGPPTREHTVAGVTGNTTLQDLADKSSEE